MTFPKVSDDAPAPISSLNFGDFLTSLMEKASPQAGRAPQLKRLTGDDEPLSSLFSQDGPRQDAQIGAPRANGFRVLVGHALHNLADMVQVVDHPGRKELAQGDRSQRRS